MGNWNPGRDDDRRKAELELVLLGPGVASEVKMNQEHAAPRDDDEYENGNQEGDDLVLAAGDVDAVSEGGLRDRRPRDQAHQQRRSSYKRTQSRSHT